MVVLGTEGEIVRIVAVESDHGPARGVIGKGEILQVFRIGGIARHAQPAGGVPAARRADGVQEHLVPLVQDTALPGGILPEILAPTPAAVVDLVETLQDEPVAAVPELPGDLRPDRPDLVLDLRVQRGIVHGVLDIQPLIGVVHAVILVVVCIDDDGQAGVVRELRHFVHPVQPSRVDGVLRRGADHLEPGDGQADAGETGGLDPVERGLRGRDAAPGRLVRVTVPVSGPGAAVERVEMIAHIPAQAQPHRELPGVIAAGRRIRVRGFPGLGNRQGHDVRAHARDQRLHLPRLVRIIGRHVQDGALHLICGGIIGTRRERNP